MSYLKTVLRNAYASMWYDYVITALFVSMWMIFFVCLFPGGINFLSLCPP